MITDGISFLVEYQFADKPLIFIDSRRHVPFNAAGTRMLDSVYVAISFKETKASELRGMVPDRLSAAIGTQAGGLRRWNIDPLTTSAGRRVLSLYWPHPFEPSRCRPPPSPWAWPVWDDGVHDRVYTALGSGFRVVANRNRGLPGEAVAQGHALLSDMNRPKLRQDIQAFMNRPDMSLDAMLAYRSRFNWTARTDECVLRHRAS